MCKKNSEVCKAKIKCRVCIDKTEEHDKIVLDIQEVDSINVETDNIVIVKKENKLYVIQAH